MPNPVRRSITKDMGSIPMGHRLQYHKGKCQFLHGHNYAWKLTLEALDPSKLNSDGMVVDFDLFKVFKQLIEGKYDHSLLLFKEDPLVPVLGASIIVGEDPVCRMVVMDQSPTVEVIAQEWGKQIQDLISAQYGNLFLSSIEVHETPTSSARVDY